MTGNIDLPAGMEEFLDELERLGWYVRSRWGDTSVRLWPDEGRRYQVTIDLRYPVNQHRREEIFARVEAHQEAAKSRGGQ